MREFKFRAWDGKRMIFKGLHDHSWYTESKGGKNVCEHNQNHEQRFTTTQYTGLKDKNGIEIYEGDVLKNIRMIIGNSDGVRTKNTITGHWESYWHDGKFLLRKHNSAAALNLCVDVVEDSEVIGNIYENGDLLDG